METKRCSRCNQEKPLSEYYKVNSKGTRYRARCKLCTNQDNREWYYENHEERIKQIIEYHRKNPEIMRKAMDNYTRKYPERRKATFRKYNETHQAQRSHYRKTSDKFRNAVRQWRTRNRARDRENHRKWEQENWDRVIAKAHRRRARVRNAGQSFTPQEWADLKRQYDFRCLCCGR